MAILALFAMILLSNIDEQDLLPYYSNGGQATFVQLLLHEAQPELFREATALERPTFDALVKELTYNGSLKDGRSVTVKEQILIFLDIVVHHNLMREVALKFRQGLFTVLKALVGLYPKYVNLTPKEERNERLEDPKCHAFNKCLGALNGVLIPITLPMVQQQLFRNRKGFIAQNVLAVVNFDLEFLYVLAGWEGSTHNSRVIADAFDKGFSILDGQFYLAEQATCGLKPATPKELFNLRHASLQNVVERIFGCLKAKFKILTSPLEHNVHSQVQLVYAITMLWNFLRYHNQYEVIPQADELDQSDQNAGELATNPSGSLHRRSREEDSHMVSKRNQMAAKIWNQYQDYLSNQ
ncbi:hypothetical protein MJO28_016383 [Puccinia striiformis f. sp. tritici]|uniref:Uncharacterized protein n=1 Tax=Puccinia striiformis f. sp. tritici TaxID=168172 RepID=A0ACC0DN06_9BASI|nr:hypothetical protein MJO29_016249 [Puccinia striiformis f. sp. tritici]KAI7935512.1 hypothetical protein MJO28_016383 [Puccinia striiformis f. sp. tritici]